MKCERCGTDRCIDKKFVPYKFLMSYSHYKDCPRFYGHLPGPGMAPLQGIKKGKGESDEKTRTDKEA